MYYRLGGGGGGGGGPKTGDPQEMKEGSENLDPIISW